MTEINIKTRIDNDMTDKDRLIVSNLLIRILNENLKNLQLKYDKLDEIYKSASRCLHVGCSQCNQCQLWVKWSEYIMCSRKNCNYICCSRCIDNNPTLIMGFKTRLIPDICQNCNRWNPNHYHYLCFNCIQSNRQCHPNKCILCDT